MSDGDYGMDYSEALWAIARALDRIAAAVEKPGATPHDSKPEDKCPECGSALETFTSKKTGARYRRCKAAAAAYSKTKQQQPGHYFKEIG